MAEEEIQPNATVYVRNLDERVKIPTLIESLREIFSEVGDIVDIIAKKNLKARGQAFIVFDSPETAQTAIDELQGFDLFERPMQLAFAKTRSDATVQREEGEAALDLHKRHRIAEKDRKQALASQNQPPQKRPAGSDLPLADRPAKSKLPPGGGAGTTTNPASTAAAPASALADEYLPPNKTLVLRELPEDYTKDQLTVIFARYPGFREVRMVPGRAGIAFAEYEDETGAIAGKEAMNGVVLGDKGIRVTYQRQ